MAIHLYKENKADRTGVILAAAAFPFISARSFRKLTFFQHVSLDVESEKEERRFPKTFVPPVDSQFDGFGVNCDCALCFRISFR